MLYRTLVFCFASLVTGLGTLGAQPGNPYALGYLDFRGLVNSKKIEVIDSVNFTFGTYKIELRSSTSKLKARALNINIIEFSDNPDIGAVKVIVYDNKKGAIKKERAVYNFQNNASGFSVMLKIDALVSGNFYIDPSLSYLFSDQKEYSFFDQKTNYHFNRTLCSIEFEDFVPIKPYEQYDVIGSGSFGFGGHVITCLKDKNGEAIKWAESEKGISSTDGRYHVIINKKLSISPHLFNGNLSFLNYRWKNSPMHLTLEGPYGVRYDFVLVNSKSHNYYFETTLSSSKVEVIDLASLGFKDNEDIYINGKLHLAIPLKNHD